MRRFLGRSGAILLAVLLALLAPAATRGAIPLREDDGTVVKWDLETAGQPNVVGGKLTYYLNPLGSKEVPISGVDELTAVRHAFDTWEQVETCRIAFLPDQSRLALKQDNTDRINLVEWSEGEIGPFTLALTFPYSVNGVMLDADLILNDDYRWETSTPGIDPWDPGEDETGEPLPPAADVQAVVTHEIGHMLGLDHVSLANSTMYHALGLGAISSRSLEPDDEAGITALYPTDDTFYSLGKIRGRATVAGKGDDRGVHIVAFDLFTRMPAATTLSMPDGEYLLEGLEPGQYRVFAFPLSAPSTLVPYWEKSRVDFLGQAFGTDGRNPGRPAIVKVKPGLTTFGVDFPSLETADGPFEPGDERADAAWIDINEVAIGLAETTTDVDWFRFEGSAGDRIEIHLDATHLGSATNPTLELFAPDGTTSLGRCLDIRPALFAENRTGPDGTDVDARLDDVTLEEDGVHYVKVSFAASANSGTAGHYYALSLFGSTTSPDSHATVITAWPPVIPADGESTSLLVIEPRNYLGDLLPPGLEVEVIGEEIGAVSGVSDHGNGGYSAVVTAPSGAGRSESFTVRMRSATGRATKEDAVRLEYVGPPDAAASEFYADPHRVEADGTSTSVLTLIARDARGVAYGPGLPVTFSPVGELHGVLESVRDLGDGRYAATLAAPTENGSDEFTATIAGLPVPIQADVRYGFTLVEVIDESLATLEVLLERPELPEPSARRLVRSRDKLLLARPALLGVDPRTERKALTKVSKAAKLLDKAEKRARGALVFPSLGFELAEAARRYVTEVLSGIRFNPPDPAGEKVLDKAKDSLAEGEVRIKSGKYDKALKRIARALKVAEPLR